MKRPNMGNPTDQEHFATLLAIASRQMKYERLLWKRLRAIMTEGRRVQGGDWSKRYVELLERAIRHQKRKEGMQARGYEWIYSRRMKPRPPKLRVVSK